MTQPQHSEQVRPESDPVAAPWPRGAFGALAGSAKAFRNLSPEEMARGRPRHAVPRALPTGRAQINRDRPSNPSEVQQ